MALTLGDPDSSPGSVTDADLDMLYNAMIPGELYSATQLYNAYAGHVRASGRKPVYINKLSTYLLDDGRFKYQRTTKGSAYHRGKR